MLRPALDFLAPDYLRVKLMRLLQGIGGYGDAKPRDGHDAEVVSRNIFIKWCD